MRQEIALKAFSVLCQNFFADSKKYGRVPFWWDAVGDEELFKKLLWFLGSKSNRRINYDKTTRHCQEIFRNFLENFAKLGWKFSELELYRGWLPEFEDEGTKKIIIIAKLFL